MKISKIQCDKYMEEDLLKSFHFQRVLDMTATSAILSEPSPPLCEAKVSLRKRRIRGGKGVVQHQWPSWHPCHTKFNPVASKQRESKHVFIKASA